MGRKSGIREACDRLDGELGLARAVADRTQKSVSQQAVSKWVKRGFVPLGRVKVVSELTGIDPARLCDPRVVEVLSGD